MNECQFTDMTLTQLKHMSRVGMRPTCELAIRLVSCISNTTVLWSYLLRPGYCIQRSSCSTKTTTTTTTTTTDLPHIKLVIKIHV